MASSSKLHDVRVEEGWTVKEVAAACGISAATLRKAEEGKHPLREDIWGKILKGINSMPKKTRVYKMGDLKFP
jgi:transcriptional regulator with XRE-family HTH domain